MEKLTTEELRTIIWLCQNETAHIAVRKNHKNLNENETYQRILSISKKASNELAERDNAD
ncbi:MAG: hypothetical protein ACI4W6_04155 [Acutalibacteraceae bacterium]